MRHIFIKWSLPFLLLIPWTLTISQTETEIVDLIRKGQSRQAKEMLMKGDTNIPHDRSLLLHGMLSINADSAVAHYEELLKTYPKSLYGDRALFRIAKLKYAQGLYKTAQNSLIRLMDEYPLSSLHQSCYYWLGSCYQAMGHTDSAIAYLRKTVDDFPRTDISEAARRDLWTLTDHKYDDVLESEQTPETRWAVQVGAFTNQTRALIRKSFFEQKGHQVELRTKVRDGETLYLVWVGTFKTRDEAKQYGEMLKKKYGGSYIPVSE